MYAIRSYYVAFVLDSSELPMVEYINVKSFTASFDAGHYLGKSNKIFTSLDLCYAFEFENVFAKDNSLSIEPSFTIYTDDLDSYNFV